MSNDRLYENLLTASREAYTAHLDLMAFAPFPNDIARQKIVPHHCTCADFLRDETGWVSTGYSNFQEVIIEAGPVVTWRETYKNTDIGKHFMDRFGCYCIVGDGGAFSSQSIRLYIVYMPAQLDYPWHHHPAEEIYLVLSGSAVFKREGCADEILREGATSFHKSNQPHAMLTRADPVLCLVAWRDGFETPPVLTV